MSRFASGEFNQITEAEESSQFVPMIGIECGILDGGFQEFSGGLKTNRQPETSADVIAQDFADLNGDGVMI